MRLPRIFALTLTVSLPTIDGAASGPSTTLERRSGFAEVSGGKLFYESTGAGEAIVLVHGNAGDHRHWDSQIKALADKYRVVRYDVRGFGKSSVPIEGESYSDHGDLATLLDDAAYPTVWFGESMHREMEIWVNESGISPLRTLQAATSDNARILRIADRTGSIRPGLEGDLLVVAGNPAINISDTRNIKYVFTNGKLVDRESLTRQWHY